MRCFNPARVSPYPHNPPYLSAPPSPLTNLLLLPLPSLPFPSLAQTQPMESDAENGAFSDAAEDHDPTLASG